MLKRFGTSVFEAAYLDKEFRKAEGGRAARTHLIKAFIQPYGLFKSMSRRFSGDSLEIRTNYH